MALPKWAKELGPGVYRIDADALYPQLLSEIAGMRDALPEKSSDEDSLTSVIRSFNEHDLDQYWLEVIYQMAKLELRRVLLMNDMDPWPNEIRIKADKSVWRLSLYSPGRGIAAATQGKEAREVFKRLRRFIPN